MKTTLKLKVGTRVLPLADDKWEQEKLRRGLGYGWVHSIVPGFGTAGEDSYSVFWQGTGHSDGSGWRDCDVTAA